MNFRLIFIHKVKAKYTDFYAFNKLHRLISDSDRKLRTQERIA